MARTTRYDHILRDGRPVAVRVPRGSTDEAMTVRENMLGVLAGAALRRITGRR